MSEKKEKIEVKKINDIFLEKEIKNVDISGFFLLSKIGVLKELFKKNNTIDLTNKMKKIIFLSIYPKIKILKLYRPFNNEIKKVTNNKSIDLTNYFPNNDINVLNLTNIEDINREVGPYSDLFLNKKGIFNFKKFNFFIFNKKIKKLFVYVFILTIFLFSYGFLTKYQIEKTFNNLKIISLTNIDNLKINLSGIKTNLFLSKILLKPFMFFNFFINNPGIDNLNNIISGTQKIIDFGIDLISIYDGTQEIIKKKGIDNIMFSQMIFNVEPILGKMYENMNLSLDYYNKVGEFSDQNINTQFQINKNKILKLQNYFNLFYKNLDNIKNILGHNKNKTYLIIFQNNDEIRPTGGFMGSVGIINIFKGKITNFEKKDIYALEWDMKNFSKKNGIAFDMPAPEGINKISKTFGLRDANYFVELSENSNQIKAFMDNTGYNIDGIFYINQNIILSTLKNMNPIYFEPVKREINAENFSFIFSTLVEAKISKTHTLATPKQILFDFMEMYFKEIKKSKNYLLYLNIILESFEKKDIMFYSFNEKENQVLKDFNLSKNYDYSKYLDFNYPIFTSISGNKSDRYIFRSFEKKYSVSPDCSIITSFNIKQKHNFNISEEINIKNLLYDIGLSGQIDEKNLLEIEGKGINKQYIRVLIPKNAIIEENKNFKIKELENYKEISFYLNTNTLFESNFQIDYYLPNPNCIKYNYILIKQPGIKNYNIQIIKDGNIEKNINIEKDFNL